jgi:hypothetical protein
MPACIFRRPHIADKKIAQRHQKYIRSEEKLRKAFKWESGSIGKTATSTESCGPQVVFHIDLILGMAGDWRRTAPTGRARWGVAHLMTSNKIRPNQCLKVFGKGLNFEPAGAIDVRWSGTQTSGDR